MINTTNTVIAIIGEDNDAADVLYLGMKSFPAEKVILIHDGEYLAMVDEIKEDLKKFKIPVEEEKIENKESLEEVFGTIKHIKDKLTSSKLIINVDTDNMSSCLALSSAFVNGIQAIGVHKGQIGAYPIMKFSYYNALSGKKLEIMKTIYEEKKFDSLEALSKATKMSLPLITYHVRGTIDKPGLEEMGLVETSRAHGKLSVKLTTLGNLITKGHIGYKAVKGNKH